MGIDSQGQMKYGSVSLALIVLYFYTVKQKDIIRFVIEILLQALFQRTVITPGDLFDMGLIAELCYQWEKVNAEYQIIMVCFQIR